MDPKVRFLRVSQFVGRQRLQILLPQIHVSGDRVTEGELQKAVPDKIDQLFCDILRGAAEQIHIHVDDNIFPKRKSTGTVDELIVQYEPLAFVLSDPVTRQHLGGRVEGEDGKDAWGTTFRWKKGDHAAIPYITPENVVCPDITEWQKYCKKPNTLFPEEDWKQAEEDAEKIRQEGTHLVSVLMATGLFEQLHFLMGFEDTLLNFIMEPDSVHELLDYIMEYRMSMAEELIRHIKPDVVLSHDDWGAKDRLFMDPDTYREFFKGRYEKLYRHIKEVGREVGKDIIVIHHADSHCAEIIDDMADMHIDIWQGALPSNDIPALQRHLMGRKPYLMGGIDAGIVDNPFATEEEVRKEVQRAIHDSEGLPGFIPCITYGLPESIRPGIFEMISEEIEKYNQSKK